MEEIIAEMKDRAERLKSFVLSGDSIHIVGTVLSPKRVLSKRIDDFLLNYQNIDISESDTMRFSYIDDCQAMIESVALRAAFNSFENSPMSFGIDSLLKYLSEQSVISQEKHFLSLTLLIENNYERILISDIHLFFVIQYEGYTILQKHTKLFNFFASQEFDFNDIAKILAYLLSHVWNDTAPENKKIEWFDYLLGIISLNPSMNDEWEYQILDYIGKHIITKQNSNTFFAYIKQRMLTPEYT